MILNDEHLEAVEVEHKQTILKSEADMLSGMLEELEAKKDELLGTIEKLTIVREAILSQIPSDQLELGLELEPES